MCERLKKNILLNEVLYEKQYKFRENSTTELTVNQIVDELIEADEKKLDKFPCVFGFG